MTSAGKPLRIVAYDATWPARFEDIGTALRARLGPQALRIGHIGSTAVPGLDTGPVRRLAQPFA